jgi:hypothetical protein
VEIVLHVTDDTLEQFAVQTLLEPETGPLVEHLVVCQSCRERLDAEIEFVTAMRGAARTIRRVKVSLPITRTERRNFGRQHFSHSLPQTGGRERLRQKRHTLFRRHDLAVRETAHHEHRKTGAFLQNP